jgi:hypothetical protein
VFVRHNRPIRKQITRIQYLVAYRLIANLAFRSHAGQNRHSHVGVVVNDHLALSIVETMQPAGILGERAFPSNRHGKKKNIKAGIIEALAEVTSGRDNDTLFGLGNCCESRGNVAALLLALSTAQYDDMPCELETLRDDLQMGGTLGYHDG